MSRTRNGKVDRDARRKAAETRNAERAARTPQQQLQQLDMLFGAGKGAVRERARLANQIATPAKEPKKASSRAS
jgi:hypothetical protein